MPAPLLPMRLSPSDPYVLQTAENALAQGHSINSLATELYVHESTLYRWITAGEAETEDNPQPEGELGSHRQFCLALERGLRAFEELHVGTIAKDPSNAPGHWQRSAWLLERRLPDRWGQKRELKVEQRAITLSLSAEVSPEVLAELRRQGLAELGAQGQLTE